MVAPVGVLMALLLRAGASIDQGSPGVSVVFGVPRLIGSEDYRSGPNSSRFWFPSISIATGIPGHVAQHVTLSGDDGTSGGCPAAGHPGQSCEQVMLTQDGGHTYTVVKRVANGTSGTFNGYGDLGTHVPGGNLPAGTFRAIVACNECPAGTGGSVGRPAFLQTWVELGTVATTAAATATTTATGGTLRLANNQTVAFVGTPAAFSGSATCAVHGSYGQSCGLNGPSPTILRLRDGSLLAAFYGLAADAPTTCSAARCRTIALYHSTDALRWTYLSRIDQTPAMGTDGIGPSESSMAELEGGRVLLVFRQGVGTPLHQTYSHDGGRTWLPPAPTTAWAVWPQLLRLSNGALVLTAGRPGIGLWVSPGADGVDWVHHDVELEHNARAPAEFAFSNSSCGPHFLLPPWRCYPKPRPPGSVWSDTSSYTGVAEVAPGVMLLAYDRIAQNATRKGNVGLAALQQIFTMQVTVAAPGPNARTTTARSTQS